MKIPQDQFDSENLSETLRGLPGPVVGVDEAGRGCLAGPVVAGAVILDPNFIPEGLTDSKLLSEKQREALFPQILDKHLYGVGFASVDEIDAINILQASFLAMRRALASLHEKRGGQAFGFVLVDGSMEIPKIKTPQAAVIKGDLRVPAIAAGSIIAKVTRDRFMKEIHEKFPDYGFAKHKGYGSLAHRQAIQHQGPCEWHRKTFKGVKEYLDSRAGH